MLSWPSWWPSCALCDCLTCDIFSKILCYTVHSDTIWPLTQICDEPIKVWNVISCVCATWQNSSQPLRSLSLRDTIFSAPRRRTPGRKFELPKWGIFPSCDIDMRLVFHSWIKIISHQIGINHLGPHFCKNNGFMEVWCPFYMTKKYTEHNKCKIHVQIHNDVRDWNTQRSSNPNNLLVRYVWPIN